MIKFKLTICSIIFSMFSLHAEKNEEFKIKSLRLNSSYVKFSDGFDDSYNQSLLIKADISESLELGIETFYTEWNHNTWGAGLSLKAKLNQSFSLYSDYYFSDRENDLPKYNFALGVIFDSGSGDVTRTIYRQRRFRNNQTVQSLNLEYIKYFEAAPGYFSVLQLGVTPQHVKPGSEYGWTAKVNYTYGKINDWRLGAEFNGGNSRYVSVIDEITQSANDIWGYSIQFGKFITENIELGITFYYTDAQSYEATGIMAQILWKF